MKKTDSANVAAWHHETDPDKTHPPTEKVPTNHKDIQAVTNEHKRIDAERQRRPTMTERQTDRQTTKEME